jgi:hypothetical protein
VEVQVVVAVLLHCLDAVDRVQSALGEYWAWEQDQEEVLYDL